MSHRESQTAFCWENYGANELARALLTVRVMDWSALDTRAWNLGMGLVATTTMAACGPTIILEADSETDAIEDTDTPPGDTENTVTPPPGPECSNASDCEPGWECIDNQCVPYDDYYCQDGGCCDDGCCYGDCYYYDCYSDEECGDGGLCNDWNECEYVELAPECQLLPELLPAPLAEPTSDDVIGLAFVDANDDDAEDLVVMHASGSTVVHPGGAVAPAFELPLALDNPVISATSGDFNGDQVSDLAVADTTGRLSVLTGDGDGGFVTSYEIDVVALAMQLQTLDWNGDGALDLAFRSQGHELVVFAGNGMGALAEPHLLGADSEVRDFATGRFNPDEFDDVVVHDESDLYRFSGNDQWSTSADGILTEQYYGPRQVLATDFDGSAIDEVVAHTSLNGPNGWVLIESWRDGSNPLLQQGVDGWALHGDSGDVDGDGTPDVVLVGPETVVLARGNPTSGDAPLISCQAHYYIPLEEPHLAVGDFDGNGRDEIAVAQQGEVLILSNL